MGESNRTVTISDVAREAGVSTATVSHVLNKTRYVSDDLTQRVNNAVKQMGYYPNQLVGSLRKKKTFTIGLILPSISNETLGGLAERIQRLLFGYGYNLIICNTSYDEEQEERALDTLLMKKADAIIAIPAGPRSDKLCEIKRMGVPIVLVDRTVEGLYVDSVLVDNRQGAFELTTYLLGLGHREIGYIDRKRAQSHSAQQRQGYLDALKSQGVTVRSCNIATADGFDYEAGYRAAQRLLRSNPNITALFGYYDVVAFGALRAAMDLGFEVPKTISVAGYDGMPFSRYAIPRLTTVLFPVEELAKKACELVISRLEEKERRDQEPSAPRSTLITPGVVVGESTGKPGRS